MDGLIGIDGITCVGHACASVSCKTKPGSTLQKTVAATKWARSISEVGQPASFGEVYARAPLESQVGKAAIDSCPRQRSSYYGVFLPSSSRCETHQAQSYCRRSQALGTF